MESRRATYYQAWGSVDVSVLLHRPGLTAYKVSCFAVAILSPHSSTRTSIAPSIRVVVHGLARPHAPLTLTIVCCCARRRAVPAMPKGTVAH